MKYTNEQLEQCLKDRADTKLTAIFEDLVHCMMKHQKISLPQEHVDEIVESCFIKSDKFNGKYKAYNFFSTIVACQLKQRQRPYRLTA